MVPPLREQNPDIVPVRECQKSTITPWLGVWIRNPIIPPAEIDDVVDETKKDFKCVGDPPRCLPFAVELEDRLSSQRNAATMETRG